jgi:hypothetical protein
VDVVLGVSVGPSTARIALIEGTEADGSVIDEAVLDLPSPRGADGGSAEIIDTIVGTRRSLDENGHRLVATGVCALDAFAAPSLRAALAKSGVDDVVLVSQDESTAALTRAHSPFDPVQPEITAALGAALAAPSALARAGAAPAPTIVLSALARPAPATASPDATQMTPADPAADATQLRSYEPQLAYSMAGNQEALTDYQPESGAEDHTALVEAEPYDVKSVKPERKPFMLVGSIVSAVVVIGLGALAVSVAVGINPTADNTPIAPNTPTFGPPPPPAGTGNSDKVPIAVAPSIPAAPPASIPAPEVAPAPAVPANTGAGSGSGSGSSRSSGGGGGASNPAPIEVPQAPPAPEPGPEVAPPPPEANIPPMLPPPFMPPPFMPPPFMPLIPPIFLPPELRGPVDQQNPAGGPPAGGAPAAGAPAGVHP